jgi:hypothetical protein
MKNTLAINGFITATVSSVKTCIRKVTFPSYSAPVNSCISSTWGTAVPGVQVYYTPDEAYPG